MTPEEFTKELEGGRRDFRGITVWGGLDLENITVKGDLDLREVTVQGDFYLVHATLKGNLDLTNARVKGDLDLSHGLEGTLYLESFEVKGQIFCGNNLPLAIQCFLYFGGRVHINTKAARALAQALSSMVSPA